MRETRKANIHKFHKILEDLVTNGAINLESKWAEVEKIYTKLPEYKNDPQLQSMDEDDFLIVYKDLMNRLFTAYRNKKHDKEVLRAETELENRMAFRSLLNSLIEPGKINYNTVWLDLYPLVENDQSYKALLSQTGATPVDLFGEVMYKLLRGFWSHHSKVKKLLAVSR